MYVPKIVSALALVSLLGACASSEPAYYGKPPMVAAATAPPLQTNYIRVPLIAVGGTPHAMVAIDGVCCFPFTVDSGAADVSVSIELFQAMAKGGHISREDVIDVQKYQTANGVIEGLRFRMPPLTVGGHTVYDVVGSVSKGSDNLLLGQSFLRKFRFWAIDNNTGMLVLGG